MVSSQAGGQWAEQKSCNHENFLRKLAVQQGGAPHCPEAAAVVPCDTAGLTTDFIKPEGVGDPWGFSGECCQTLAAYRCT